MEKCLQIDRNMSPKPRNEFVSIFPCQKTLGTGHTLNQPHSNFNELFVILILSREIRRVLSFIYSPNGDHSVPLMSKLCLDQAFYLKFMKMN